MKSDSGYLETIDLPFNSKKLVKHCSVDKLKEYIKDETDAKVLLKLIFIKNLYDGISIQDATENLGYTTRTGYRWINEWNKEGKDGLKIKWSDGRPSRLTDKQLKELKKFVVKDHN